MQQMDEWMLDDPTLGVLSMQDMFCDQAITINVKRIGRLMGLMAIYPRKNLSALGSAEYIHPYLLRNLKITRANQVWAIDISYIPMQKGFMYLTAIIDVFSRKILSWILSNSLAKKCCLEVLDQDVRLYGSPEIINSDQGSQFTSKEWVDAVKGYGAIVSIDGKGRAIDNIYIERFWRTLKQRYVYLNPESNGLNLIKGIEVFMEKYNRRRHQGIGRIAPNVKYKMAA
jgi:putative transposase